MQGGNTGNISLSNGCPVSDTGRNFQRNRWLIGGNQTPGAILFKDCTTGSVNLPGWDMYITGTVTLSGDCNCRILDGSHIGINLY